MQIRAELDSVAMHSIAAMAKINGYACFYYGDGDLHVVTIDKDAYIGTHWETHIADDRGDYFLLVPLKTLRVQDLIGFIDGTIVRIDYDQKLVTIGDTYTLEASNEAYRYCSRKIADDYRLLFMDAGVARIEIEMRPKELYNIIDNLKKHAGIKKPYDYDVILGVHGDDGYFIWPDKENSYIKRIGTAIYGKDNLGAWQRWKILRMAVKTFNRDVEKIRLTIVSDHVVRFDYTLLTGGKMSVAVAGGMATDFSMDIKVENIISSIFSLWGGKMENLVKLAGLGELGALNYGDPRDNIDAATYREWFENLKKHIGEVVVLAGGGGPGVYIAWLRGASMVGKYLQAHLEKVYDLEHDSLWKDKFNPYMGSWQIFAIANEEKRREMGDVLNNL